MKSSVKTVPDIRENRPAVTPLSIMLELETVPGLELKRLKSLHGKRDLEEFKEKFGLILLTEEDISYVLHYGKDAFYRDKFCKLCGKPMKMTGKLFLKKAKNLCSQDCRQELRVLFMLSMREDGLENREKKVVTSYLRSNARHQQKNFVISLQMKRNSDFMNRKPGKKGSRKEFFDRLRAFRENIRTKIEYEKDLTPLRHEFPEIEENFFFYRKYACDAFDPVTKTCFNFYYGKEHGNFPFNPAVGFQNKAADYIKNSEPMAYSYWRVLDPRKKMLAEELGYNWVCFYSPDELEEWLEEEKERRRKKREKEDREQEFFLDKEKKLF